MTRSNPSTCWRWAYCPWRGARGTYFWVDPQEKLVGVLMMQNPAMRVHHRTVLRDLLLQAIERPAPYGTVTSVAAGRSFADLAESNALDTTHWAEEIPSQNLHRVG